MTTARKEYVIEIVNLLVQSHSVGMFSRIWQKSLTPLKAGRACVERPSHTRTSKRNTVQKNIGNGMSNATSRRNKSSMERRQGPGGFTLEAKNNLGTANARMNVTVTVPQSFKLATSKRTGMVSNPSDEEGTLSRKTIHNTAPLSCSSPLKRTRVLKFSVRISFSNDGCI